MNVMHILAGIAVSDVDDSLTFYERLLGRPSDARPMPGLADWSDAAGTLQLVQDPERAGRSIITLTVDDLRGYVATLRDNGLDPADIDDTTSDKVLIASITDPDGNQITLVEQK